MKNLTYDFISVRAWHSYGAVDTAACTSLKNAKSAGITTRDVYLFPCPTCSASAKSQMDSMINWLQANCGTAWSGKIWLDIEGTEYWYSSTTTNRTWYQSLVDACKGRTGITCGVYASYYQWESIFGSPSYCYGQNLPLWYAHYDGHNNFSDYV